MTRLFIIAACAACVFAALPGCNSPQYQARKRQRAYMKYVNQNVLAREKRKQKYQRKSAAPPPSDNIRQNPTATTEGPPQTAAPPGPTDNSAAQPTASPAPEAQPSP